MATNRNNRTNKKATSTPKVEHKSKLRPEPTRMGRGPTKTFQQDGHWIVKIKKTPIFVCECGNKYLKTRGSHQLKCLRCMAYLTTSEHR